MSKMHITIGIYPNGDWKWNCVPEENLKGHIEYQDLRPGRMFLVDGKIVNKGIGVDEALIPDILEKVKRINPTKDSQPYI